MREEGQGGLHAISASARRLSAVTVHSIAQHTLRSRCSESESLGPPDCNGSTSAADPSQHPAPCTDAGHPRVGYAAGLYLWFSSAR